MRSNFSYSSVLSKVSRHEINVRNSSSQAYTYTTRGSRTRTLESKMNSPWTTALFYAFCIKYD